MSQVLIVYEPDDSCVDPLDEHGDGRRHVELIPDDADCVVIWRKVQGDPDGAGHVDTHIYGMGTFANVTIEEVMAALAEMGEV